MTSRFSHNFWSEWMQNQTGNFFENSGFDLLGEDSQSESPQPEFMQPEFAQPDFPQPNYSQPNSNVPAERFLLQGEVESPVPPGCQFYLPPKYEHNYAYPLIIWLHGDDGNEHNLLSVMPEISDQNFLGLSFRGNKPSGKSNAGRTWDFSPWEMDRFEEHLHDTVCELRQEYHIHSERIFLAGFDSGATVALNLLQNRTDWFGGALLFGGRLFNQPNQVLESQRDGQGTPVLLGLGSHDHPEVMADHVAAIPFLKGTGIEVSTRMYEAGHEMTGEMLRDINYWIMDRICSPAAI